LLLLISWASHLCVRVELSDIDSKEQHKLYTVWRLFVQSGSLKRARALICRFLYLQTPDLIPLPPGSRIGFGNDTAAETETLKSLDLKWAAFVGVYIAHDQISRGPIINHPYSTHNSDSTT
jgi:hypothetical protein